MPGGPANLPPYNVGVDVGAPENDPVTARVGGVVVSVYHAKAARNPQENSGWGGSVVIKGDDGHIYRYSHLAKDSITVRPGQRVDQGQQFGKVGMTGNATGPHVDVEARDAKGNPLDFTKLALPKTGTGTTGDTTMADGLLPGLNEPGGPIGPPGRTPPPPPSATGTGTAAGLKAAREAWSRAEQEVRDWEGRVLEAEETAAAAVEKAAANPMDEPAARKAEADLRHARSQLTLWQSRMGDAEKRIGAEEAKAEAAAAKAGKPDPTPTLKQVNGVWHVYNPDTGRFEPAPGLPVEAQSAAGRNLRVIGRSLVDDSGNVVYTAPEEPGAAEGRAIDLETARTNLAIAQQRLQEATSPEAREAARLKLETARFELEQAQRKANAPTVVQTGQEDEFIVQMRPDGSIERVPNPNYRAPNPATVSNQGRVVGYDPLTGEQKFSLDTRTPEEIELGRMDTAARRRAIDAAGRAQQEVEAALAMPAGRERDAAVRAAVDRYQAVADPVKLLDRARADVEQQWARAEQLSTLTGIQHDPETMAPMIDAATGQPMPTAAEAERRAKRAEEARRQEETERSNLESERGDRDRLGLDRQRAVLDSNRFIESELTARERSRTEQVGQQAAGLQRDNIGPERQAANLANATLGMTESGIRQMAQQMGVGTATLDAALAAFRTFQDSQNALRARLMPVPSAAPEARPPVVARPPSGPAALVAPPAPRPPAAAPPPLPLPPPALPFPAPTAPPPPEGDAAARRRGTV